MSEITAWAYVLMAPAQENLIDVISEWHKAAIFSPPVIGRGGTAARLSSDWSLFKVTVKSDFPTG